MTRAVLVLVALCLTGCGAERRAMAEARAAVKQQLKDPSSARFGEAFLVRQPGAGGQLAVCGTVDGRNSFGGYSGGSRYVVRFVDTPSGLVRGAVSIDDGDRRPTIDGDGTTVFEKVYWNTSCTDAAHPKMATAEEVAE